VIYSIRYRGDNKGFTMIELVVILAILSVMALIAIPDYINTILPRHRLNGAARDIMTDMRHARMRSASVNREYRVSFTVGSETYQIEKGNLSSGSSAWTLEGPIRNFANASGKYYHYGVDISSISSNPVLFKPTGWMTSTTIQLANEKGQSLQISSSNAGRIMIQ